MEYRLDKQSLLDRIGAWDSFINKKIHLIACGGTALTLLGLKLSTKDVDLMVPNLDEYEYLIGILKQLGYRQASGWGWELESPLVEGNHLFANEFENIYLGVLNYYDLIISKLFRGTTVDLADCLTLIRSKSKDIDFNRLKQRFKETASFDVSNDIVNKNFSHFLKVLGREGLINGK